MVDGNTFLVAMDRKAKIFAPAAGATVEANQELCSWLLDPLARWARRLTERRVFEDAARGYAKYCVGGCQGATSLYEKGRPIHAEAMPEIISGGL